ncbi:unnamed protein product [Spirodela intermedia]|uniref:SUN domain-containing protein n=1 Tax=Spirodela intermedia TaxID=51605 RepID=A0A7I8ISS6_SPIIN|nr:unnamed protein product [Spirodela intermedia]CAA6660195.1 unnamed protein product [Spirodela intermedia]
MQGSSRRLPQGRAACENSVLGRNNLYKATLLQVLLLWGLVFILSFVISHGNGHQDEHGVVTESKWCEVDKDQNKDPHSQGLLRFEDVRSRNNDQDTHNSRDDADGDNEFLMDKINEMHLLSTEQGNMLENICNPDVKEEKETPTKTDDRLSRIAPPGLDEFKSRTITPKGKQETGQVGSVVHRVEPGGKEYNYASAAKGAKVLAFNKEAKGASNILDKDKDKYLRNPCSAEDKFVIIELSEETLVVTIEIVNFEHYSSNMKDFELLSSLVYPSDTWVNIGNFTASNVKHAQRFAVQDPKWARYLRLNLVSHYGSEFYCTLSALEVYGVDAVERMLVDLISVRDAQVGSEEPKPDETSSVDSIFGEDQYADLMPGPNCDQGDAEREALTPRLDAAKGNGVDRIADARPSQGGRMPGDTVLKILMQKVQHLVVNFSILERYIEELNGRYGQILKDLDIDIRDNDLQLEKIREELKNLQNNREELTKDISELLSWKLLVSLQLESLVKDSAVLRMEMEGLRGRQAEMENRGLAVVFICFLFGSLAVLRLFTDTLLSVFRLRRCEKFCPLTSSWSVLLLCSTLVALILVL